jgi:hypothetical protein
MSVADAAAGKYFDRMFLIIFENQGFNKVMKDTYFASLAARGSSLTNFYAITHPSQPNYISQIAGSPLGCTSDSNIDITQTSLVDLFEEKGNSLAAHPTSTLLHFHSHVLTHLRSTLMYLRVLQAPHSFTLTHITGISWRAYEEAYPGKCFTGAESGTYVRKHNPFMSFTSVTKNATRCANIVPATQLDTDLKSGPLPSFVYYTPDLNNDAHDTNIAYASKWLNGFLEPKLLIGNFINRTAVFLTWDEDDLLEGNHIYSVLLGPVVKAGAQDNTHYTHYSLTRTLEDNWGLASLGRNDASTTPFAASNYK